MGEYSYNTLALMIEEIKPSVLYAETMNLVEVQNYLEEKEFDSEDAEMRKRTFGEKVDILLMNWLETNGKRDLDTVFNFIGKGISLALREEDFPEYSEWFEMPRYIEPIDIMYTAVTYHVFQFVSADMLDMDLNMKKRARNSLVVLKDIFESNMVPKFESLLEGVIAPSQFDKIEFAYGE